MRLHSERANRHKISDSDQRFVIFDLDGTLIDSFECVLRCVNKTLDLFFLPHVSMAEFNGHSDIALIFEKVKIIIEGKVQYSVFKNCFDEIHLDDCTESIYIRKRVCKEMIHFHEEACLIVVLTNKYQPIAEKICRYFFNGLISVVLGRIDLTPVKSDLFALKTLFRANNLNLRNCVCYYGDSELDYIVAKRLKIKFISV